MYIAMNRFRIIRGQEAAFVAVWKNRESHLEGVPGFLSFHLLRGPEHEEYTLFASHSTWESPATFVNWTHTEAFRKAHASAGGSKGLYLGHPEFEGFEIVI